MKARDNDSGTNAEITYSVSDDHYRVDNKGIIYNRKTLDADDNNAYYEFMVTATDRGAAQSSILQGRSSWRGTCIELYIYCIENYYIE